jgi:hypothetical protein
MCSRQFHDRGNGMGVSYCQAGQALPQTKPFPIMAEQTEPATQGKQKRAGNRRAYPRFSAMFEVRYAENKEPMQTGKPLEISEGGLSFETQDLLPLETQVNVEFKLDGAKDWIKVKGVVRHSKGKKLGVEFLNLRISDRLKIVDMMATNKKQ